jgi:hypothetical protein
MTQMIPMDTLSQPEAAEDMRTFQAKITRTAFHRIKESAAAAETTIGIIVSELAEKHLPPARSEAATNK